MEIFLERADDLELQISASRLQSSDGDLGGGWFNIHCPCVTLKTLKTTGTLFKRVLRDSRS